MPAPPNLRLAKSTGITSIKINGNDIVGSENGEYYEFALSGIELKALVDDITITIGSSTGTYSLAKYIADNNDAKVYVFFLCKCPNVSY